MRSYTDTPLIGNLYRRYYHNKGAEYLDAALYTKMLSDKNTLEEVEIQIPRSRHGENSKIRKSDKYSVEGHDRTRHGMKTIRLRPVPYF